jgi:polyisoprenoid-binding protein YceI
MKNLSPAAALLFLVAGCQSLPPAPDGIARATPTEASAAPWPAGTRFVVDRDRSRLRLIVRAEGPMARLGHPHVIGGSVMEGEIVLADPFRDSALRLGIDVNALAVDRPAWRRVEGFEPNLDEEDIAGTRRNMRSPELLDARTYPEIRIESNGISGPRWQPDIRALVTLAGATREVTVPVALTLGNETLTASGRFVIRQTDFGLTPYSTAGGALRVSDEVLVRFRILATLAKRATR